MTDGKMFFKKMDLSDLQCNPFDMIGKAWYLLTSGTPEDYNTMTASWGAMGEMWGAPSFHCVVRTNRYTLNYLDQNELFSATFFDPGYKPALQFCGTHSGKDCDKAQRTGLQPEGFLEPETYEKWYGKDPMHREFVGEVLAYYERMH